MTAAISWRPQLGTTRIPGWLHTLPDSLSQDQALNGALPSPVSALSSHLSQSHSPTPLTVLVQSERRGWIYLLIWAGRMVVSAGLQAGEAAPAPQLPTSCLPAHPAASPSPTRTKFPTCLSVSDSSRKYLAARAPAVLSPLRLLPCLPRGALQTQPGMGGGQSQKAWWAVGVAKAGGTSLNSEAPPPTPGLGD